MKIGRTALDDETKRRIEEQNPDIEFDWPRILKGVGSPATEPRPPVEVRRNRQTDGRREHSSPRPPAQPPPRRIEETRPAAPLHAEPEVPAAMESEDSDLAVFPSEVEQKESVEPAPIVEDVDTPAHARLGAEGVGRLRARYAEIRARVAERVSDPARREALAASVERLNPDTWTSPDEVTAGLEQYEVVLASLREVVGRRRRKRRRGGRRDQAPASASEQAGATESADEPEAGDEMEDGEEAESGENDSGGGES